MQVRIHPFSPAQLDQFVFVTKTQQLFLLSWIRPLDAIQPQKVLFSGTIDPATRQFLFQGGTEHRQQQPFAL